MTDPTVKEQVRRFYDSIGWRQIGDGLYQNARFEDLRPVAQEYLHRCHLRVNRHLPSSGRYMLDAGSGPIQYPEYLTYSEGFDYRVCLDISFRALVEARQRIGGHGLYVVADVARLPFKDDCFGGLISMHTVHHLPAQEHEPAYRGFYRVLKPGGQAATIYSWGQNAVLTRITRWPIKFTFTLIKGYRRLRGRTEQAAMELDEQEPEAEKLLQASGTFTYKHHFHWMQTHLSDLPGFDILVWRSISTSFMRAFIHRSLAGAFWLRLIYQLEEWFPRLLGRIGQYPMILFEKPSPSTSQGE
jgi:ubiquinone/menaquinone biosynthesis C-methylase UbiE